MTRILAFIASCIGILSFYAIASAALILLSH